MVAAARVVASVHGELPLWPPILATRAPGADSVAHAHHAMHVVLALTGSLRVRAGASPRWRVAAGVVTAPDVAHAIDGTGAEVLLVFLDPESDAGVLVRRAMQVPVRLLEAFERDALASAAGADPARIMRGDGAAWASEAVRVLGGARLPVRRIHPRVRRVVRHLARTGATGDVSLAALARVAGISESRLMHAFTESIGLPLRPYLAWLKLQRAAAGIAGGLPLAQAAHAAGFADAAHMSRTFRRMFGTSPSRLRPLAAPRS